MTNIIGTKKADIRTGTAGDDSISGMDGDDILHGAGGRDTLDGGKGKDALYGDDDADVLIAGVGNDVLFGGAGTDTAVYSGTSSSYRITQNTDGSWTVDDLRKGNVNEGTDVVWEVERLKFADKVVYLVPNQKPTIAAPLEDQNATVGASWSYQFAAGAFADADGDSLTYTALLSDGTALPAWLALEAATRTFSGTAPSAAAGTELQVKVTAYDGHGGTSFDVFTLAVAAATPVNHAPTDVFFVTGGSVNENQAGALVATLGATDPDAGEAFAYTVTHPDGTPDQRFVVVGSDLLLAPGVALDFEATPSVNLLVTATDSGGLAVGKILTLAVADVPETIVPLDVNIEETVTGTRGANGPDGLSVPSQTGFPPEIHGGSGSSGEDVVERIAGNYAGTALSDSVKITLITKGGDGGWGGNGGNLQDHSVYEGPGRGGAGAAGGSTEAVIRSLGIALGVAPSNAADAIDLRVEARGGDGGWGGPGGGDFLVVGGVGADGGNGWAAGHAAAAISDITIVDASPLSARFTISAIGGSGGSGGGGGGAGVNGEGGDGGGAGDGGDALASLSGLHLENSAQTTVIISVSAFGGGYGTYAWGEAGVGGPGGGGPGANFNSPLGGAGLGGEGGDGGNGTAQVIGNDILLGDQADFVSIFATGQLGQGGHGGAWGIPHNDHSSPAGQDGAGRVEVVNNTISLGGGNDVLTLTLQDSTDNYSFSGNSFDGGSGYDVLNLTADNTALGVDVAAGSISIGGLVGGTFVGFEEIRLADGSVYFT